MKSPEEMIAANRSAWDASAPYHQTSEKFAELKNGFSQPHYSCLDALAKEQFQAIGVAGKDVAQLACNNGRELLSVKNMGAAACVGFDQSAAFLEQARELSAAGNIDCRFIETDVNRISSDFEAAFDIVFITIGVLGWMPDLQSFLGVAARLLRPRGVFFVYEQHPIMGMFEPLESDDPFKPRDSYFQREPFIDHGPIVYDGTTAKGDSVKYWFLHQTGDIINGCIEQGLRIEQFREYPHNISSVEWDIYNDQPAQLPQCYTLIARKDG